MRRLCSLLVLLLALVGAAASVLTDPRLVAGSECCACLQETATDGTALGPGNADQNCLPGDTAEDETCSEEVATQMVDTEPDQPIRVVAAACYQTHCAAECQSAQDNGLSFETADGG
ncbi:MAG: hypothetical protein ABIJ09_20115 [Pseudomonadota bacterium]